MSDRSKEKLEKIAMAFMPARVMLTAVELDIFTTLSSRELTAEELAREAGTHPPSTERLLNALTAIGILRKRKGRFRNTEASLLHLAAGQADSQKDIMRHRANLWRNWSDLTNIVRTGRVKPCNRSPGEEEDFIRAMADVSRHSARECAGALKKDLAGVKRLLDLGGGPGTYACAFAAANPGMRATVLDRPGPLKIAKETIAKAKLKGRVTVKAGDAVTDRTYGRGYDAALLSNFIHAFKPDTAREVIGKAGKALARGGRMMVKEFFVERDGTHPPFAALFSINMLAVDAGDVFTQEQVEGWMTDAGIEKIRSVPVAVHSAVLVGVKA